MKRAVTSLAILALFCHLVRAEVDIAIEHRIKNRPPGRCGWCAIETLARHHGIEELYGLTRSHASQATPGSLSTALNYAGVRYRIQYAGNYSRQIIREAIKEGLGAAVGLTSDYNGHGPHIVTLVDYGKQGVKIIDSNDKERRIEEMTLKEFLKYWDGFALVLEQPISED